MLGSKYHQKSLQRLKIPAVNFFMLNDLVYTWNL